MGEATSLTGGLRAFQAFRSREFRLVWSAQAVSLVGDAAFVTALGWKTFTLAGSGKLGIVLVCQSLAVLATVLIGGALADRLPRRTMMIASDLARCAAVGALAGLDASRAKTVADPAPPYTNAASDGPSSRLDQRAMPIIAFADGTAEGSTSSGTMPPKAG